MRTDSVNVAISDLRIVNVKLIELNYEKEINKKLNETIKNDSIIIQSITNQYNNTLVEHIKDIKKIKKERNIYVAVAVVITILFGINILK